MKSQSGLHSAVNKSELAPLRVSSSCRVSTSQIFTDSRPPDEEMNLFPSGEKAKPKAELRWPWTESISSALAGSKKRTRPRVVDEATSVPSGEVATEKDSPCPATSRGGRSG